MNKYSLLARFARRQGGQALISMLVFMAIGAILLAPLLSYIGTALIVGQVYQEKAADYYAADAGIVDAQWQIDNERLSDPSLFGTDWDPFNYGTPTWGDTVDGQRGWYDLTDSGDPTQVNSRNVSVQIKNRWLTHGIDVPTPDDAQDIISTQGSHLWVVSRDTGNLQPTTGTPQAREFEISIFYNPVVGENLNVVSFGAWIPPGFSYDASRGVKVNGTAYTEATFSQVQEYGGTSLVWVLNTPTLFENMPGVNDAISPLELNITFFQTKPNQVMTGVGWVTTSGVGSIPYSWDARIHVLQLTSKANSTYVDAMIIQQETLPVGGSLNGDYYATGNSLLAPNPPSSHYRSVLYRSTSATVATNSDPLAGIPASAQLEAAYLYWSGWIDWEGYNPLGAHDTVILDENCSDFISPPLTWTRSAGSRWGINNSSFRARGQSGSSEADRTVTSSAFPNLTAYSGQTIVLSWDQSGSNIDSTDYVYFKLTNSTSNTGWIEAFHGTNNPTSPFTYVIPQAYLTNSTTLSFYIAGSPASGYSATAWTGTSSSNYDTLYIDNITIVVPEIFYDDGTSLPGAWTITDPTWNVSNSHFRGYGDSELELGAPLNLSAYTGVSLAVSLDVLRGTFATGDHLYVSFSGNGGGGWSPDGEVFVDLSQSSNYVSYLIPDAYKTNNFKMRFTVTGSSSRYVYLDNITISGPSLKYPTNGTPESIDNLVSQVAKVNKVMFGTAGNMALIDTAAVDALGHPLGTYQTLHTPEGGISTWAYAAMYDATDLIKGWIASDSVPVGDNGAAVYLLEHAFGANTEDPAYSFNFSGGGSTGYPLGTAGTNEYAYAGWSLVRPYSSPETRGHQLWLYDIMNPSFHFTYGQGHDNPGPLDHEPDFNGDGQPGGYISGFLVPANIQSETNSSKITFFVGEGDNHYDDDYFEVNGVRQSNAFSPEDNVLNSASPGLSISGLDIDTFYLNYPLLQPGATSAQINVGTNFEYFTFVYIIISFRSDVTTGGAISYLIR